MYYLIIIIFGLNAMDKFARILLLLILFATLFPLAHADFDKSWERDRRSSLIGRRIAVANDAKEGQNGRVVGFSDNVDRGKRSVPAQGMVLGSFSLGCVREVSVREVAP